MPATRPPPIHPVILSGGRGTRLWPASRTEFPKQFLPLMGAESLLQATVRRAAALPGASAPVVISGEEHRFLVREQLLQVGIAPACICLEPEGRNTAPAIALAALHLSHDPQALMLVMPADHLVDDQPAFAATVATALPAAQADHLCTFGIVPTRPETGYGYIQAGPALAGATDVLQVSRFIEKPELATAQQLLAEGGHWWNSGIFLFNVRTYLAALQTHRPDVLKAAERAWADRTTDMEFERPQPDAFRACPAISIDYAIMQPTTRAVVVKAGFAWSDIGSWESLWHASPKDAEGNCVSGDAILAHTRNSYVRAEHRLVSVVGLDNVAVVETADAVLVLAKGCAQDVRAVTDQLDAAHRPELLRPARVYRPWGWYETTDRGERFQVKRLMLSPGRKISLQLHHHRAEHWVVVSGTALVTVNGEKRLLQENQSAFVPQGHQHQLENPGTTPLHIIEVQSGAYLGEDDIVRFDS